MKVFSLQIITKDELEIKKNEDYFKGSKVLVDKTNSDFSTLPLIATDGSLVQSRPTPPSPPPPLPSPPYPNL